MSDTLSLDFVADDSLAGFRMTRLEVFNWGTFDRRVWSLNLNGKNALLTGDIGSGKTTLVDAVTSLLVPAHRVAFNKAAGADARERTLRSYILGHYKSERNETSGTAKPVGLRDQNSYSVILGVFHNAGYEQTVTLAQVFWFKDPQAPPARFYVACEGDLTVASHFSQFGTDIGGLRKRLRSCGAEVFDSFPLYGAWFKRRFDIKNDQALELFHQTVSMKSVGNLTDFVRGHMLEAFDVQSRIKALVEHFDDLNRAHEAVLKAKRQLEMLEPLVADCERYGELMDGAQVLRDCRDALKPYFAGLKLELIDKRLLSLAEEAKRADAQIARLEEQKRALQSQERELRRNIAENGGDRIEGIAEQIRLKEEEQVRRKRKDERYAELVQQLGLSPAKDEEAFFVQRQACEAQRDDVAQREADLQNKENEARVEFARKRQEHEALMIEINSLKARRTNIDAHQITIRASLCRALDLDEDDMPFAGELIQVRQGELDWEGAIERYLHSFGLSLLVPDAEYVRVVEWVDATHLKGRLVYFRVRHGFRSEAPSLHADSLAHKLEIRPDTPFYEWIERELTHRANIVCCKTHEQFRREPRAITQAGQIKEPGERHEKDDRYRLDDRGRYVLGWDNAAKIAVLEGEARTLDTRIGTIGQQIASFQKELTNLKARGDTLSKLEEYRDFRDLDWRSLAVEIAGLQDERRRFEEASDILKTLADQLKVVEESLADVNEKMEAQKDRRSRNLQKISDAEGLRAQTEEIVVSGAAQSIYFEQLTALRAEHLGEHTLAVESCDNREQDMRQALQARLDAEQKRIDRSRDKIIGAMNAYKAAFSLETQDVDASVDSASEYQAMLDEIKTHDLPRFESKFKELLNENTIREVANFQSQLWRERETIKERIDRINESLTQIDYNPGRYIRVEAQPTQDADIRDFHSDLRACTEGALTGSDDVQYSEAKFLQVKQIIERFRGREGSSDLDRRWTTKVTDVRNWFVFGASERWREDDSEHEHYSDSGGKSGGQKEKLAYTVLAASLAYQFGLEWGAVRSRSFRFVVIDEAFGRGSDESAEYGLKLFQQLNLQILIVTPLQKIHIIEPFVSSVGFVHNEDGRESKIRNLSIEEYKAEKAKGIA